MTNLIISWLIYFGALGSFLIPFIVGRRSKIIICEIEPDIRISAPLLVIAGILIAVNFVQLMVRVFFLPFSYYTTIISGIILAIA